LIETRYVCRYPAKIGGVSLVPLDVTRQRELSFQNKDIFYGKQQSDIAAW